MRYALQIYRGGSEYLYEDGWIPAEELPYSPLLLERLAAVGAIEPRTGMLSRADAGKVEKILRLRRCLGVNLSGAVIIAELMERLDAMELEIDRRGEHDTPLFF
jgi:MerR family transcriptional regulator/heat shock protein HspR